MGGAGITTVVFLTLLFGVAIGLAWATVHPLRTVRYRDPQIHEGVWRGPKNSGGVWHHDGIPWCAAELPPLDHQCSAQTCTIMPGLAHEDKCACGGTRYGVYGQWRDVNSRWAQQQLI